MRISIIAAMDEKGGIGKNGKIPWNISEDFKRFKAITMGHPIIMGRKTWKSLPFRPLPNRTNIVITQNTKFNPDWIGVKTQNLSSNLKAKVEVADSIEKAVEIAEKQEGNEKIFIIGGGQIFKQAISMADKLYLTIVEGDYECDSFFPDYSGFKKKVFEENRESGGYKYKFVDLER